MEDKTAEKVNLMIKSIIANARSLGMEICKKHMDGKMTCEEKTQKLSSLDTFTVKGIEEALASSDS